MQGTSTTTEGSGQRSHLLSKIACTCLFVAVAAKSGGFKGFRVSFADFFFLLFFGIAYINIWRESLKSLSRLETAIVVLVPLILLPVGLYSQYGGFVYLAACTFTLSVLLTRSGAACVGELHVWTSALGLLALGVFLCTELVPFWTLLDAALRNLSEFLNQIYLGHGIQLGPTYWDWELLLFYAILIGLRQIHYSSPPHSALWKRCVAPVMMVSVPLLVLPLLYLLGAALANQFASTHRSNEAFFSVGGRDQFQNLASYLFPANIGLLLIGAIILLDVLVVRRQLARRTVKPLQIGSWQAGIITGLLILAYASLIPFGLRREVVRGEEAPVVFIYDPAKSLLRPPSATGVGASFFAKLPVYIEKLGYQTRSGELTQEQLKRCDVLVLINLSRTFPPESTDDVLRFVRAGGSLLCLGDHTGREDIREPFNRILQEVGIRFNFDSACPLRHWSQGLIQFNHYVYSDPHPSPYVLETHAIGVGASLNLEGPARPVFIGRFGFSDPGNANNRGGLGNLKYDYGEPLGDLVLAAEASYGKGKIVVFGDTSPFQNSAICRSYNLVARTFGYLVSDKAAQIQWPYVILMTVVLAVGVLLRGSHASVGLAVALLVLVHTFVDTRAREGYRPGLDFRDEANDSLAFIDTWHHSTYDMVSYTQHGIGGVDFALLRRNKVTLFLTRGYGDISAARYLFLLAPTSSVSPHEVELLKAFLAGGGIAVITCGYDNQDALRHVFEEFGISIPYLPLGAYRANSALEGAPEVNFRSGWPLEVEGDFDSICNAWGRDVIVRKRVGDGSLAVVGDARFLIEANLEGPRRRHNEANIRFFRDLLTYLEAP